ncbi:MAG: 2-oxo acid dehydrogenase subunit E2, partial [Deltaproteobacteria bacterium]|nr:2-oxo acid dehydrogenase subunit E2 [Deltaproteobacteria bacterium]
ENMRESLRRTSQLTLHTETDVTEALALIERLRQAYRGDDAVRFSLTHLVVLAAARALERFPRMNATLVDDEIRVHRAVHVGIAVALPDGLIVPVLRDAHRKGLEQIAREVRDLARRAREGTLGVDETSGGTFTVTSLAGTVVDGFTPILRPPETGILGVGRVVHRPVARDGEVCVRPVVTLSLTFDHGVIDGAPAAEFLGVLCGYLEHPATLLA